MLQGEAAYTLQPGEGKVHTTNEMEGYAWLDGRKFSVFRSEDQPNDTVFSIRMLSAACGFSKAGRGAVGCLPSLFGQLARPGGLLTPPDLPGEVGNQAVARIRLRSGWYELR